MRAAAELLIPRPRAALRLTLTSAPSLLLRLATFQRICLQEWPVRAVKTLLYAICLGSRRSSWRNVVSSTQQSKL